MGYLDPEADSDDEETGVKERCKSERSERDPKDPKDPKEPKEAVMHSWLRGFTIVLFNVTTSIMLVNSVKCLYDAAPVSVGFSFLSVSMNHMCIRRQITSHGSQRPNPRIGVDSNSLSSLLVHTWSSLGSPQQ